MQKHHQQLSVLYFLFYILLFHEESRHLVPTYLQSPIKLINLVEHLLFFHARHLSSLYLLVLFLFLTYRRGPPEAYPFYFHLSQFPDPLSDRWYQRSLLDDLLFLTKKKIKLLQEATYSSQKYLDI